jgi:hypothetical protein
MNYQRILMNFIAPDDVLDDPKTMALSSITWSNRESPGRRSVETGSYTQGENLIGFNHLHDNRATLEEHVEDREGLVSWRLVLLRAFVITGASFFVVIVVIGDGLLDFIATFCVLTSLCILNILVRSDVLIILHMKRLTPPFLLPSSPFLFGKRFIWVEPSIGRGASHRYRPRPAK